MPVCRPQVVSGGGCTQASPGVRRGAGEPREAGAMPTDTDLRHLGAAPLLITADPSLETDVRRLAAAAGVGVERIADPAAVGPQWMQAPVVLVGADAIDDIAHLRPSRRKDVHVLSSAMAPTALFREALAIGAETVTELPEGERWLVELLTDTDDGSFRTATVIGVIGASGGAGASTMAAALGIEAARTRRCLLIDADPCGGGVEQVAGLAELPGIRWEALRSTGRLGGRALRESLPGAGDLSVLAFVPGATTLPATEVVRETISAAQRGFDLVVVDHGRYRDPAGDLLLGVCEHVYVVSPLTISAVTAGSRLRPRLPAVATRLIARGPERGLHAEAAADLLSIPLAAVMRDQTGLDEAVVLGSGPVQRRRGPLARTARRLLDELS